jgi:hypothetical protein
VDKDSFLIDFKTEFRGQISLNAESKNLNFKGYASLNAPKLPYKEWFTINCDADKKDLAIPYDVPVNYQQEPLRTGIYLSKESGQMYPNLMTTLFLRKDREFLDCRGLLKYNLAKDQFYLGDSLKVANIGNPNKVYKGNLLIFNHKDGKVQGEGKFNIGSGLNGGVKITAAGTCTAEFAKPASDTMTLQMMDYKIYADMMVGLDFMMPDKLLNVIVNDFALTAAEASDVEYNRNFSFYEKALSEIITDPNEWSKVVNNMKERTLEIPKKYNKFPFLFSYLPMRWNSETQSFVSIRDNCSLASINGEKINKMITAYVEFRQLSSENDDRVNFYIKTQSDNYYLFAYQKGTMNVVSNNPKFMEVLATLKKDEKSKKLPNGETYLIESVDAAAAATFVERIKQARLVKSN